MAVKREKVHFETVEELLGAPASRDSATEIRVDQIHPFKNHPFKVVDDDNMKELTESIRANGVIVPVLVRLDDKGTYEMVSGHRRMHAAKLAGLNTIPAIVKSMTNDEAVIAMVDANMQREEILPSERAFSLKMKLDAVRRQGKRTDLTSGTEFPKLDSVSEGKRTREVVGAGSGIGGRQVTKYIRLTELNADILSLVDEKRLSITMGVEISYFDKDLQKWLYTYIKGNGMIRQSQIDALKNSNPDNLTEYTMIQILNDALPHKKDDGKLTLSRKKLDKYFAKTVTTEQREQVILDLLEKWKRGQN